MLAQMVVTIFLGNDGVLDVNNLSIGMIIIAAKIGHGPPFHKYRIFQEMQNVWHVGSNFKAVILFVDTLFRSSGGQFPNFHASRNHCIVHGMGVEVARAHDSLLAIQQIEALAADSQTVNVPTIVYVHTRDGGLVSKVVLVGHKKEFA